MNRPLLVEFGEIVFSAVGLDSAGSGREVHSGHVFQGADDPGNELVATVFGEDQIVCQEEAGMEGVAVVLAEKEEDVSIGVGWLDGEIVVEHFAGGESRVEEILVGFVIEEVEGGPVAVRENALGCETGRLVVVNQFAGQGGYDVGDIQFDGLPCFFD